MCIHATRDKVFSHRRCRYTEYMWFTVSLLSSWPSPQYSFSAKQVSRLSSLLKEARGSYGLRSIWLHDGPLPNTSYRRGNRPPKRHVDPLLRLLPRNECIVNWYVVPFLIPQRPHTDRSGCTTGLIAGRIIRSNRRVREFRMSGVGRDASQGSGVVDIIVQSAAVYSCALVVILIAMFTATVEPLVVLGVIPSLAVSTRCPCMLLFLADGAGFVYRVLCFRRSSFVRVYRTRLLRKSTRSTCEDNRG